MHGRMHNSAPPPRPPSPGWLKRSWVYLFRFSSLFRPGYSWWNWIEPDLAVGGWPGRRDLPRLQERGVTAILDLCEEFPPYGEECYRRGMAYLKIEVPDRLPPSAAQMKEAVDWIDERIRGERRVLIHCGLGAGRSVTVAAAFLASRRGRPVDEAIGLVKMHRPQAHLSPLQRAAIEAFAQSESHQR